MTTERGAVRRWVWLAATCAFGSAVAAYGVVSLTSPKPRATDAAEARSDALEAELGFLKRKISALESQRAPENAMHIAFPVAPQTAESAPAGSAEPRSAGSKGTPADQAALVEEQQRALEAREKTVESALESQPVDRNWAQDVASTVSAAMSEPELAGSSIERLDCRSTICRIEISHVDQAARDNFFAAFQLDVHSLPNGMMIPREGANGRPATLAFFSREGTRLPVAANN